MNTQDSQSSQPQEDAPHRFRTEIRSLGYGHKPFNSSQSAVPNATELRSLGYGHKPYKRFQSLLPSAAARKASQNDQQPEKVLLTLFTKTDTPSPPSSASSDTDIDTDTEPISAITQQPDQPQGSHTVTNQPQALSTTSVAAHSTQPSLLPDHIFVSSVGKPYNRDWITKHGIDETVLQGFSSKHQFRSLIANDVIKLGDKLRMTYNNGNEAVHKEGTLIASEFKSCPDIVIAVSRPGVAYITLKGCAGPTDFITTMNNEFSASFGGKSIPSTRGWRKINLISSEGQDFGTLWTVRQAYHIWVEEKDKWAVRNSRPVSKHAKSVHARPSTNVSPKK